MSNRFVVCFLVIGFGLASQADAQLFRRWGPPPTNPSANRFQYPPSSYSTQQYTQNTQRANAPLNRGYVQPNCQQNRIVYVPARQMPRSDLERQIVEAQYDLARRRQLVAQLQESLMRRNRSSNLFGLQRPQGISVDPQGLVLPNQKSVQRTIRYPGKEPVIAGKVVTGTRQPAGQVDIARGMEPTLVLSGPIDTQNPNSPLIEPAIETPSGVVKDSQVVQASADLKEGVSNQGEISILESPGEQSVLEKAVDKVKEIGEIDLSDIELNGPDTGK